jgi:hypothetical protein
LIGTVSGIGGLVLGIINFLRDRFKLQSQVGHEGIKGMKLIEGNAPAIFLVPQDGMEKYKEDWHRIRAAGVDTAGKVHVQSSA